MSTSRSKDFWSGVIFLAVGAAFAGFGRNYSMGTTMRMGPGYFPTVLGALLAAIGLVLIVRALLQPGPPVERLAVVKLTLVIASVVIFGLLVRPLGLAGSIILLVLLSSYASARFKWPVAVSLAVGLALGSSIIFVWLLRLPIPVLGAWLGG